MSIIKKLNCGTDLECGPFLQVFLTRYLTDEECAELERNIGIFWGMDGNSEVGDDPETFEAWLDIDPGLYEGWVENFLKGLK